MSLEASSAWTVDSSMVKCIPGSVSHVLWCQARWTASVCGLFYLGYGEYTQVTQCHRWELLVTFTGVCTLTGVILPIPLGILTYDSDHLLENVLIVVIIIVTLRSV